MRPFAYIAAPDAPSAVRAASVPADAHVRSPVQLMGGGTTLLDLMKLDVMRPTSVVDMTAFEAGRYDRIETTPQGLRLGALVTMADAAENATVVRDYPMIAQSLAQAASAQLRNMARLGGNALQRTRCNYFAIRASRSAISAIRDRAAPRSTGTTGCTRCWERVRHASPATPAISRRR